MTKFEINPKFEIPAIGWLVTLIARPRFYFGRQRAFYYLRLMSRATLQRIPLRANRFQGLRESVHRVLFIAFMLQFLLVSLNLWTGMPDFGTARWPEGLL